jgi:ABC-type lipoprotein release transport system permease subunit
MFFTYLRRELRRRVRQAIVICVGLALCIGLVIAVTAASSGVKADRAQRVALMQNGRLSIRQDTRGAPS